jgi:hypothetical protein
MASDLVERARRYADDPMWADHAEVPKRLMTALSDRITRQEAVIAGLVDALDNMVATASAIRAMSVSDEWATSSDHIHDLCGSDMSAAQSALAKAKESRDAQ